MRRSGFPTEGATWGRSHLKPQSLKFSILSDITSHQKIESPCPFLLQNLLCDQDHMPHIGKKMSLTPFRQTLGKLLPAASNISYTIMTYLKKLVGTKPINTEQCPAGLSPRIIPPCILLHTKNVPFFNIAFLPSPGVNCCPFS